MAKPRQTQSALLFEAYAQLAPRKIPVQERSKKAVDQILETAAVLVDETGVANFSMSLLAQRSGVQVRNIYRYFPSKLGVLMTLMMRLNHDSLEQLALSALADPERDWRELVNRWIDDLMTWAREQPGARFLMGWTQSTPELTALQERLDEEWAHDMARAMRKRGVRLPPKQLYAVCRSFDEVLDALSALASSDSKGRSTVIVDEMRHMLIAYMAKYLD